MSRAQSHVLRKSLGEYEASLLVEWLNSPRRSPDHLRIERLLDNLAVVGAYRAEGRLEAITAIFEQFGSYFELGARPIKILKRSVREIREELARYRMRPVLLNLETPAKSVTGKLEFNWDYGRSPAGRAILLIMTLGKKGMFWRVRRCLKCKRWFFAKFRHQYFDSTKCQQAHYKSSPEWREHRREYMREYRHDNYTKPGKEGS